MAGKTIFYSWQSDLPNPTNRGFIEECLAAAVKKLNAEGKVAVNEAIDTASRDLAGAVRLDDAIFQKVDLTDVFVADISYIDVTKRRLIPNPNVMIELGYAVAKRDWSRIICVLNDEYGPVEKSPFDIDKRVVITYSLKEGEDKTNARRLLIGRLKHAVESILLAECTETTTKKSKLLTDLFTVLSTTTLYAKEIEWRWQATPKEEAKFILRANVSSLRELALRDEAGAYSSDFLELAEKIEAWVDYRSSAGSADYENTLSDDIVSKAMNLRAVLIDPVSFSGDVEKDCREAIEKARKQLEALSERAEKRIYSGKWDEVQQEAADIGRTLWNIGYVNLDVVRAGASIELREIGEELHGITRYAVRFGGHGMAEILGIVTSARDLLNSWIERFH